MIDSANWLVSSAVNDGSSSSVRNAPATRNRGGAPALICRSEPSSSASRSEIGRGRLGPRHHSTGRRAF